MKQTYTLFQLSVGFPVVLFVYINSKSFLFQLSVGFPVVAVVDVSHQIVVDVLMEAFGHNVVSPQVKNKNITPEINEKKRMKSKMRKDIKIQRTQLGKSR